jgi:hypothetical protein
MHCQGKSIERNAAVPMQTSCCPPDHSHTYNLALGLTVLQILDKIRRTVEDCDSLQSFLLLHSLGGGTGSGVGTYILELLAVSCGWASGHFVISCAADQATKLMRDSTTPSNPFFCP